MVDTDQMKRIASILGNARNAVVCKDEYGIPTSAYVDVYTDTSSLFTAHEVRQILESEGMVPSKVRAIAGHSMDETKEAEYDAVYRIWFNEIEADTEVVEQSVDHHPGMYETVEQTTFTLK